MVYTGDSVEKRGGKSKPTAQWNQHNCMWLRCVMKRYKKIQGAAHTPTIGALLRYSRAVGKLKFQAYPNSHHFSPTFSYRASPTSMLVPVTSTFSHFGHIVANDILWYKEVGFTMGAYKRGAHLTLCTNTSQPRRETVSQWRITVKFSSADECLRTFLARRKGVRSTR